MGDADHRSTTERDPTKIDQIPSGRRLSSVRSGGQQYEGGTATGTASTETPGAFSGARISNGESRRRHQGQGRFIAGGVDVKEVSPRTFATSVDGNELDTVQDGMGGQLQTDESG